MSRRPDNDDYRALFLGDVPIMDMRAPAEFMRGAFPCATSLPLMTDDERAQVGICYKQGGQAAAIALGHELVSGDIKRDRLRAWIDFARQNPNGYLYCFRGGLRSQTVQQWLRDEGIDYPLITGGYKAMRRFLLEELERLVSRFDLALISGKTGTGKTRAIQRIERSVDLEGLAMHRGSTFGQLPEPQPSQIDFENALTIALMKMPERNAPVYLEDEGQLIGRLCLPDVLRLKMAQSPMLVVEEPLAQRVDVVIEDYVVDLGQRYARQFGPEGHGLHSEKLQQDLLRIRKRLGGERHRQVSEMMANAFAAQRDNGDLSLHRDWIALLLEKYYDPMYEYQLSQRQGEQVFVGDREAVIQRAARDA